MSLRTLMQAGPVKANELFARLSDTSDEAVKTREKLFGELKAELELHTGLEEQHLFPILRRSPETKELVTEAMKDNKALRAKLGEVEALPKNDEAFPERLKELQKTFRQHARDEKRELLPAVQRALSEEQVQTIAEKIEAGVVEAEQARHDEIEVRRAKVRQEREAAEQQAEREAAAERAQQAAAARARQDEAERRRAEARQAQEQADRQAEQAAGVKRAEEEAQHRVHELSETAARTALAAQTSVLRIAENAATGVQRVSDEVRRAGVAYRDAMQTMTPDFQAVADLPRVGIGAMTEIRSAWMNWMGQTTRAGTQMSQDLLRQGAAQQRRFVTEAVQGWIDYNAQVMRITTHLAQAGVHACVDQLSVGSKDRAKAGSR